MHHTCEHCDTRYDIPDDKVAGRFLKVRCKRCQRTMHVVGLVPETGAWWAAIGAAPRGPFSEDDVRFLCGAGDIHGRTRMWCRGMPGWQRVCESETLAWVYREVITATAEDAGDPFGRAALLSDGHGYFPDPTLQSGIILLDEEAQRSLAALARKSAGRDARGKAVGTRAWPSLFAPAVAAVFGAFAGAAGILWFIASQV